MVGSLSLLGAVVPSRYFSFAGRSLDALMQLGKQACVATAAGLVFIILLVLGKREPHSHR